MIKFTTLSGAVSLTASARDCENIPARLARELGLRDVTPMTATMHAAHEWAADGSYSDHRYEVMRRGGKSTGIVRIYK